MRAGFLATVGTVVLSLSGCDEAPTNGDGSPASGGGGKADDANAEVVVGVGVTASSVELLQGDLSSIKPTIEAFVPGDGLRPEVYLRPMGPIGHYGPLGAYGPLGVLGPVGDDAWNASKFISLAGPWAALAEGVGDLGGPLSADGPLGEDGPLNPSAWREALTNNGDVTPAFIDHLQTGGLFSALGPAGPLGALGPLGPLGPVGAHGYVASDNGEWIPGDEESECVHSDERDVCRTVEVPWNANTSRTYELFENYDEAFAQAAEDNDTSFMVVGAIDDEIDEYRFQSRQTQNVTVVLLGQWTLYDPSTAMGLLAQSALRGYALPTFVANFIFPFNVYDHERSFDDFDVTLTIDDGDSSVELTSQSGQAVDWISVVVPANAKLTASVNLASRWSAPWRVFGPEYRLFVVGSTSQLAGSRVSGDHQVATLP